MDSTLYWVWLQRAAGKGANLDGLLDPFGGSPKALFEASPGERRWRLRGERILGEEWEPLTARESFQTPKVRKPRVQTLDRINKVSLSGIEELLETCRREGITLLTPENPHYPPLLREIPNRPAVLYALGDVTLFSETTLPIAMVGAREARLTSLCTATGLAGTLARCGLLVVSGGAIGTDAACHIGALNAGYPTVAVLGTGIGTAYLKQNAELRRVISHNGVLLSEMEPGEPGSRGSFPLRNRIIAGMSIGTVVVEAAVKSGSLITSKYAEDYSRDIFVPLLPGSDPATPRTTAFAGTRELLQRESGIGIRTAADLLNEYAGNYGLVPEVLADCEGVSAADLSRDVSIPSTQYPPCLSREMAYKARLQLRHSDGHSTGHSAGDLAGEGSLNPDPGWGPYRTRKDAATKTYTAAEFAYRQGDGPLQNPTAEGFQNPQRADSSDTPDASSHPQENPFSTKAFQELLKNQTEHVKRVLYTYEKDPWTPKYMEDLIDAAGISLPLLFAALADLQLQGLLDMTPDQRFALHVPLT